jgi:hypothetical protein
MTVSAELTEPLSSGRVRSAAPNALLAGGLVYAAVRTILKGRPSEADLCLPTTDGPQSHMSEYGPYRVNSPA